MASDSLPQASRNLADAPRDDWTFEDVRRRMSELGAITRRLKKENRRLQSELRLARPDETIHARLHNECFSNSPERANSSLASTPEAVPLDVDAEGDPTLLSRVLETEENSRLLEEQAAALRERLRPKEYMDDLRQDIDRMQKLLAQKALAAEAVSGSKDYACSEEFQETPPDELLSRLSFQMFATVREVELAAEKEALQQQVRRLEQARLTRSEAPFQVGGVAENLANRRNRRRLQQMGHIAACLHQELQQQRGPTPGSPRSLASDVQHHAPDLAQCLAGNISHGPASSLDTSSNVSPAKTAISEARGRAREANIRRMARRFQLRRDLR